MSLLRFVLVVVWVLSSVAETPALSPSVADHAAVHLMSTSKVKCQHNNFLVLTGKQ